MLIQNKTKSFSRALVSDIICIKSKSPLAELVENLFFHLIKQTLLGRHCFSTAL